MNALHKLQRAFAADLWDETVFKLEGVMLDSALPAKRLFQVYRNNFQASLGAALTDIYPVVERLVGREFFAFLADRFLRVHPSRSGDLHELGEQLPGFLSRFQPAADLVYMPDVARLEWAYHRSYHARSADLLEVEALARVVPAELPGYRFALGPTCQLLRSEYPIFQIWRVNQDGYEGDDTTDLCAGGQSVLVVRPQLEVEPHLLDAAESLFLTALAEGAPLGEAVDAALSGSSQFGLEAMLAKYLMAGVLVAPDTV